MASLTRVMLAVHISLPSEASGPGVWPALMAAAARRFVIWATRCWM